jgi:hypothetical protein
MSQDEERENPCSGLNPYELTSRLLENFDDQRELLKRLDELESEAIDLRIALAPAIRGWDVTRLLVGRSYEPRLMLIHKRVNGGIEVTIHDLIRAEDLAFPEPEPPKIGLMEGTPAPLAADLNIMDSQAS